MKKIVRGKGSDVLLHMLSITSLRHIRSHRRQDADLDAIAAHLAATAIAVSAVSDAAAAAAVYAAAACSGFAFI
jgi:hypothetical protein